MSLSPTSSTRAHATSRRLIYTSGRYGRRYEGVVWQPATDECPTGPTRSRDPSNNTSHESARRCGNSKELTYWGRDKALPPPRCPPPGQNRAVIPAAFESLSAPQDVFDTRWRYFRRGPRERQRCVITKFPPFDVPLKSACGSKAKLAQFSPAVPSRRGSQERRKSFPRQDAALHKPCLLSSIRTGPSFLFYHTERGEVLPADEAASF